MSAFVNQLRARGEPVRVSPEGSGTIMVRVEMAELWDMAKFIVAPGEPVLTLKRRALEVLCPSGEFHEDFVMKYRGWEIFDEERTTIAATGAVDGSSFLVEHRLRRPVR